MKLVVGGYSQGKLQVVLEHRKEAHPVIFDGVLPEGTQLMEIRSTDCIIINHFHLWVKNRLLQQGDPEEEIMDYLKRNQECIIISDEIGNGIVPLDAFEREYRERTGRILVKLAERADEVVRVICGIGQRIK